MNASYVGVWSKELSEWAPKSYGAESLYIRNKKKKVSQRLYFDKKIIFYQIQLVIYR